MWDSSRQQQQQPSSKKPMTMIVDLRSRARDRVVVPLKRKAGDFFRDALSCCTGFDDDDDDYDSLEKPRPILKISGPTDFRKEKVDLPGLAEYFEKRNPGYFSSPEKNWTTATLTAGTPPRPVSLSTTTVYSPLRSNPFVIASTTLGSPTSPRICTIQRKAVPSSTSSSSKSSLVNIDSNEKSSRSSGDSSEYGHDHENDTTLVDEKDKVNGKGSSYTQIPTITLTSTSIIDVDSSASSVCSSDDESDGQRSGSQTEKRKKAGYTRTLVDVSSPSTSTSPSSSPSKGDNLGLMKPLRRRKSDNEVRGSDSYDVAFQAELKELIRRTSLGDLLRSGKEIEEEEDQGKRPRLLEVRKDSGFA